MKAEEKSVRRAIEAVEVKQASGARQRDALQAVLLFYSASPWDVAKRDRWFALTGAAECTSRTLCDFIRQVLAETGDL